LKEGPRHRHGVPRTLLLPEARQAEVARLVREELVARGARLDEQTPARTVFEDLPGPAGGFRRGGYVGTYQAVGEKRVEVLAEVYAHGPRQAFWGVVGLGLLATLALFVASPPSAVFFLASLLLWGLLVAVAVLYHLTGSASRALEEDLVRSFEARFREAGWAVLDEEQQLEQGIRARLEGELKQREVAALPPPPKAARGAKPGKPGLLGRRKA
jgi:hypothetical protein